MPHSLLDLACPPHLEDEAFMIETSGEMPEVALQESLVHLGALAEDETACLRGAVARAYLRLLDRDLDHRAVGLSHFRGLERAFQNLSRLRRFLGSLGQQLPPEVRQDLRHKLEGYLEAEASTLEKGRSYASARADQVREMAEALGLELAPHARLLDLLTQMPAPDFRGLAALRRLEVRGGAFKRRAEKKGTCILETLAEDGRSVLARANLPLLGPNEEEDPQARHRVELVWSLLPWPALPR